MAFTNFFPGSQYVDVIALDVYNNDFGQKYYDDLMALAKGKPMALAEVGNPPPPEVLDKQPNWTYYMTWAGMVRNTPKKQYKILMNDPRYLNLEDSAYIQAIAPFRTACGLPPLTVAVIKPTITKPDFSGVWVFNEDKSILDNRGFNNQPDKMEITLHGNDLKIKRTFIVEYADDRVAEEDMTLDGKELKSTLFNSPRVTTVKWSEKGDMLNFKSTVTFNRGGQPTDMITTEDWSLLDNGKVLSIHQLSDSFRGKRDITLVFDKQ